MRSVAELLRLDGRVAIVTGGAGHLGLAAAEALAEQGASLVIVDRDANACSARANELAHRFGVTTYPIAVDLAAGEAPRQVVDETLQRFSHLDVLINNAAFVGTDRVPGWAVPWAEQSLAAWDAALRVNLTAPFLLCQAASESLAKTEGAIVNVGSIYGVVGPDLSLYAGTQMANPAAYGASKGGLLQLTRYLATVLAPRVRVNAICPGGIERGQPEAFRARYVQRTPLGRMGREEDMKGAIAFLASPASAYVTGQTLLVDGGWTAW